MKVESFDYIAEDKLQPYATNAKKPILFEESLLFLFLWYGDHLFQTYFKISVRDRETRFIN